MENNKVQKILHLRSTALNEDNSPKLPEVNDIEIDFERLKNIPKVYYTWKDDTEENLQIGTSAQKVQEIYPELTSRDADSGKLALDYAKLSIIALKAIDTLHEENKLLRKELEELKEKVNTKRTRKKKTE